MCRPSETGFHWHIKHHTHSLEIYTHTYYANPEVFFFAKIRNVDLDISFVITNLDLLRSIKYAQIVGLRYSVLMCVSFFVFFFYSPLLLHATFSKWDRESEWVQAHRVPNCKWVTPLCGFTSCVLRTVSMHHEVGYILTFVIFVVSCVCVSFFFLLSDSHLRIRHIIRTCPFVFSLASVYENLYSSNRFFPRVVFLKTKKKL